VLCFGIGILHRNAQGIQSLKRLTQDIDAVFGAQQVEFKHA
jgi:hypothetical protein